ncbi:MAG: methyltransferase domain-containing protein [Myxococcales bacterium]|nr:methyltransferase domain-containing protein [Myxococcales bacterium]
MNNAHDYLLGAAPDELERLRFQDEVWEDETEAFLDRLEIAPGARVLEIGCGIGLSLPRLARRVGPAGEVVAIERNAVYARASRALVEQQRLANVRVVDGDIHTIALSSSNDPNRGAVVPGKFDLIFARWVLSFYAEVETLLVRLRTLLASGGALAVIDYNHDGVRIFPSAPAFDRVIEAFRSWYHNAGGDLWVAGTLAGALHKSGFHCEGVYPHQKAGAPGSPVYRWVEQFVRGHGPSLVAEGELSREDYQRCIDELDGQKLDPAVMLFSPIVVGVIGRAIP